MLEVDIHDRKSPARDVQPPRRALLDSYTLERMREVETSSHRQIARVVQDAANGTLSGPDELIEAFYPELKRLASTRMRAAAPGLSWQPTLLVNELYLELVKMKALRPVHPLDAVEKSAFFALAGQVMRWLLVRHVRLLSWKASKQEVSASLAERSPGVESVAQLDDLLAKLSAIDPQLRTVVELRVFEGLSIGESAERLGVSSRTVNRHWKFARIWLQHHLFPG